MKKDLLTINFSISFTVKAFCKGNQHISCVQGKYFPWKREKMAEELLTIISNVCFSLSSFCNGNKSWFKLLKKQMEKQAKYFHPYLLVL